MYTKKSIKCSRERPHLTASMIFFLRSFSREHGSLLFLSLSATNGLPVQSNDRMVRESWNTIFRASPHQMLEACSQIIYKAWKGLLVHYSQLFSQHCWLLGISVRVGMNPQDSRLSKMNKRTDPVCKPSWWSYRKVWSRKWTDQRIPIDSKNVKFMLVQVKNLSHVSISFANNGFCQVNSLTLQVLFHAKKTSKAF